MCRWNAISVGSIFSPLLTRSPLFTPKIDIRLAKKKKQSSIGENNTYHKKQRFYFFVCNTWRKLDFLKVQIELTELRQHSSPNKVCLNCICTILKNCTCGLTKMKVCILQAELLLSFGNIPASIAQNTFLRKHPNTASFVAPFLDHFIAETNKINLAEQKGQCKHCDTLFYQLWFFFTRILISTCLHA